MKLWKIGMFLDGARKGYYKEYYTFLGQIGFRFNENSLLVKLINECEAIDDLVNHGVVLEKIAEDAMMSDYIDSYKENDFCIGKLIKQAKTGQRSKAVMLKLNEYNFNTYNTQDQLNNVEYEKVCSIIKDVAEVYDINSIKQRQTLKDILPEYECEIEDFKIGVFLKNVKSGCAHNKYRNFLEDIGFDFSGREYKVTPQIICEIIDQLIEKGVDLNKINSLDMISNYMVECKRDFCIGQILDDARIGKGSYLVRAKLKNCGFPVGVGGHTRESVLTTLQEVAAVNDINKIRYKALVKDVLPNYKDEMENWGIGAFLSLAKTEKYYQDYLDFLKSIGVSFEKTRVRHSTQEVCDAIDLLVQQGVDINKVPQKSKMSDYIPSYKYHDLAIGSVFSCARRSSVGKVVRLKLKEYGFDFDYKKFDVMFAKDKLNIFSMLVKQGVDLNTIKIDDMLSNYIDIKTDEANYPIGIWLKRAKQGIGGPELLQGLIDLGYKFKGRNINLEEFAERYKLDINK